MECAHEVGNQLPGARPAGRVQGVRSVVADQAAVFHGAFVSFQIGEEIAISMSRAKIAKPS